MNNMHDLCPLDNQEREEWRSAVENILATHGQQGLQSLMTWLQQVGAMNPDSVGQLPAVYRNTLDVHEDLPLPEDDAMGERAEKINLWNAMAMVARANAKYKELGGHISTYASSSTLYRIGFDYFFQGDDGGCGDLIFFQGHASPGVYARSFLEGRFCETHLDLFRQETTSEAGLSSYPHPWLMPDYWQFPTVSMGLGPLQAVHQADWLRYLQYRGLAQTESRTVWAFCGDGEMDEPESTAALAFAARERLDNCVFVINCNLQRLDGPVRGNGQIITELERLFHAQGWRVLKVMWGCGWDKLWQLDTQGEIQQVLSQMVDGELQALYAQGPQALLAAVVAKKPSCAAIVNQLSEDDIRALLPGGHDPVKVYSAYHAAKQRTGRPTVIIAHTIKGYQLGGRTHARNIAHNKKTMTSEDLQHYAAWCEVPLTQEEIARMAYYHPGVNSDVGQFVKRRRQELGGHLPKRSACQQTMPSIHADLWQGMRATTGDKPSSTTMAFVRMVNTLLRDKEIGPRLVPIVADEARTFGMEGLFKKIGIYASQGQQYQPEDSASMMSYQERQAGQLLQMGLTEASATAAWLAAATSYATTQQPMVPMYIFYSMFGFQRVGDLLWLAGDMRARGFLLGATAGRTTLGGEGLQHNDGHSHVMASLVPNCISYDPCFQYELATIMVDGIRRMYTEKEDVFYYITLMNENYPHPAMPEGVEDGILKGMYCLQTVASPDIHLLGSGTILREVMQAQQQLQSLGVHANVWSVTSFTELAREGLVQMDSGSDNAFVRSQLGDTVPVLAATDYVRAYAEQIRPYLKNSYHVLGTDGFGRSDTRARLRAYFQVDANSIVEQSMQQLRRQGRLTEQTWQQFQHNQGKRESQVADPIAKEESNE